MQFRRVGFFALVAVALVGCGTAASHALAVGGVTTSTLNICPSSGPTITTGECVTTTEQANGQLPAHMSTIPDSALVSTGLRLTVGPQMAPTFSKTQCEATIEANGVVPSNIHEGLLALWQTTLDDSTPPSLVWVFNVTPVAPLPLAPDGHPYPYALSVVNATTGQVVGGFLA